MHPLRASLFFIYCLIGLAAFGTSFSHVWQTHKILKTEQRYALQQSRKADAPPEAPPIEPAE